jgi:hypothetical protein
MLYQNITEVEVKPDTQLVLQRNGWDRKLVIVTVAKIEHNRIYLKELPTLKFGLDGIEDRKQTGRYRVEREKLYALTDEMQEKIRCDIWVDTLKGIEWGKLDHKTVGDVMSILSLNGIIE